MKILGDNETSFTLTRDPKNQNHIKHINIIYHHVRELVENEKLAIKWVSNSNMLADNLTKALPAGLFKKHQEE